jgi:hypothetical protein
MADLRTISVVIATASVVIAATYYILIVRNIILTREAQIFMQLYQGYTSEDVDKCMFMPLARVQEIQGSARCS